MQSLTAGHIDYCGTLCGPPMGWTKVENYWYIRHTIYRCQEVKLSLEAFHGDGAGPSPAIPACDDQGNYAPTQCGSSGCYCVENISGEKIDGTDFKSLKSEYALACDKCKLTSFYLNIFTTSLDLTGASIAKYVVIHVKKLGSVSSKLPAWLVWKSATFYFLPK